MNNRFKHTIFIILLMAVTISAASKTCAQQSKKDPIKKVVNEALDFSVQQGLLMAHSLKDRQGALPRTTDRFGNLQTCRSDWWVSGFFPGMLWYLYEYSDNEELKKWAHEYTLRVEDQLYTANNHDVCFIIFCSFGNGFQLTRDSEYLNVIRTAAGSLITCFRSSTGCIRSWDYADWNKQWQYPVIIDNMMNLELLLWTASKFDLPEFYDIAVSHANSTIKNHYRSDYSCYHVVSYDTLTGLPELKQTAQGYSDESAWARGQAWGLYGFTMMYRYTRDTTYLNHARNIAGFIINHPRLPDNKIPYWDFDTSNIPDCYRDASVGNIICSALIELSHYVEPAMVKKYLQVAETQIQTLSSLQYRNLLGNNGNFVLKHRVGHMPNNTEVDVPLTYADYYFVEAMTKFKKLNDL